MRKKGQKLTVSSSEIGQGVVTLLTVHNILEVHKKKDREKEDREKKN